MKRFIKTAAALILLLMNGCSVGGQPARNADEQMWEYIPFVEETPAERFSYTENTDGVEITGCTESGAVRIPGKINGKPVVSVSCSFVGVYELVFPDTVSYLAIPLNKAAPELVYTNFPASVTVADGFSGLTSLKAVFLSDGVAEISEYCFRQCEALEKIYIPSSVAKIGSFAFSCCRSLKSVVVPDGVTELRESVFERCESLSSVSLPETLTVIGSYAFSCCKELSAVEIPLAVRSINWNAFEYCSALENVEIPEGVTALQELTFQECSSLRTLILPDSIGFIGPWAIWLCENVTVTYKGAEYSYKEREALYTAIKSRE